MSSTVNKVEKVVKRRNIVHICITCSRCGYVLLRKDVKCDKLVSYLHPEYFVNFSNIYENIVKDILLVKTKYGNKCPRCGIEIKGLIDWKNVEIL